MSTASNRVRPSVPLLNCKGSCRRSEEPLRVIILTIGSRTRLGIRGASGIARPQCSPQCSAQCTVVGCENTELICSFVYFYLVQLCGNVCPFYYREKLNIISCSSKSEVSQWFDFGLPSILISYFLSLYSLNIGCPLPALYLISLTSEEQTPIQLMILDRTRYAILAIASKTAPRPLRQE